MTSRNRVAYMPSETWLSYQKRRHPFVHDTSRRFFNALRVRGTHIATPETRMTTITRVVTPTITLPADFAPL